MWSKGICWIDDCRIPFVDDNDKGSAKPQGKTLKHKGWDNDKWLQETIEPHTQGRFPANILVSDDVLNDGSITKSEGGNSTHIGGTILKIPTDESKRGLKSGFGDKGTNSRYYDIDKWFDKLLDE